MSALSYVAVLSLLGGARAATLSAQVPDDVPKSYQASRAIGTITVDGRLDEAAWNRASRTEPFVDIRGAGHPSPTWETRARLTWDDDFLYVGATLEEPHLWGTLVDHDAIIYHDHDFEVFLDPDGDGASYFEVEINVLGTVLDLFLDRPYSEGGKADLDWDLAGLRSAIHVDGTVNDNSDTDRGWSVELAIPWSGLVSPAGEATRPPSGGDVWRVNFSRVQWPLHHLDDGRYERAAEPSFQVHHEDNWVWSPQGEINMHIPGVWGFVHFVREENP